MDRIEICEWIIEDRDGNDRPIPVMRVDSI
jgi:hypothetical protein